MSRKAIRFCLELDVHAVTCPGVWLCPDGNISLRVQLFKNVKETERIPPVFPLLYHEKFIFQKLFPTIHYLSELQQVLNEQVLQAELIQWPKSASQILLATFHTTLLNLLYPANGRRTAEIDLLMEPSHAYPGILSPKIEASTKTIIDEVAEVDAESTVTSKLLSSMCHDTVHSATHDIREPIKRQRKVCHSIGPHEANMCRPTLLCHPRCSLNETCSPFSIVDVTGSPFKSVIQTKDQSKLNKIHKRKHSKGNANSLVEWSSLQNTIYCPVSDETHNSNQKGAQCHTTAGERMHDSVSCIVCSLYKTCFDTIENTCSTHQRSFALH